MKLHTAVRLSPLPGDDIKDILRIAQNIARSCNLIVSFKFNNVCVEVAPGTDLLDELAKYYNELPTVNCKPSLP